MEKRRFFPRFLFLTILLLLPPLPFNHLMVEAVWPFDEFETCCPAGDFGPMLPGAYVDWRATFAGCIRQNPQFSALCVYGDKLYNPYDKNVCYCPDCKKLTDGKCCGVDECNAWCCGCWQGCRELKD